MRLYIGILIYFFALSVLHAQEGESLIAPGTLPIHTVQKLELSPLDNEVLLAEEMDRREPGKPPKFARAIPVDVRPAQDGSWEYLSDGTAVWRINIESPEAYSINLGFTEYYMPAGGKMIIYDPSGEQVMGPFTPLDNEVHNELWTPVFPGEALIIEVQVPVAAIDQLQLWLTAVNHDFVDFMSITTGACHLDAICGASDGFPILDLYRDIIQSVAVIGQGGDTFCTGFLVNNTRNDCTPYFMTAHHCNININNDQTVFAYWNYQNGYCRQPGSSASGLPGNGLLNNFNTGTIWRAGYQETDFTLLEFDDPIPSSANAFFAGWSREATPPRDTLITIHHPDGAEKRVSIAFEDSYPGTWGGGNTEVPNGNHLIVPDWSIGSTESGSSGAPLFNSARQVTGQLHGGGANCSNDLYDSFGWFRSSWNGGGTPFTRLKDWLDPVNLNPLDIDGRWMSSCDASITLDDASGQACSPGQALFYMTISEHFPNNVILSTTGLPSGSSIVFSQNPAAPGSVVSMLINLPDGLPTSTINFVVNATDGVIQVSEPATIQISSSAPIAPTPITPANNSIGQNLRPLLSWGGILGASWYEIEIAENIDFTELSVYQTGHYTNTYLCPPLVPYTQYYYRIRGHNLCGASPWSTIRTFTTAATACMQRTPYDLPLTINGYANEYVTSTVQVNQPGTIASVSIENLEIDHSYVGDLSVLLKSPSGTIITLFDQPGYPAIPFGCSQPNIRVNLSDDAASTNLDFENTCSSGDGIAISGDFQPQESFSDLVGESSMGTWKLIVVDKQDQDGGKLINWKLNICYTYPLDATEVYYNSLITCTETENNSELFVGYGFQDSVYFNVYNMPSGMNIEFEHQPVAPGSYVGFTISGLQQAGGYNFILSAEDGENNHLCYVPIEIIEQPIPPLLLTPDNESPVFQEEQQFTWSLIPGIDTFIITVARNFALTDIVFQSIVTDNYYPMSMELEGGIYFWNIASVNPCGSIQSETFSFYKENVSNSAESTADLTPDLHVFPNPVYDKLHLVLKRQGQATAHLYNTNGSIVQKFHFDTKTILNVSNLPSGIYLLEVQQGENQFIQRIVK